MCRFRLRFTFFFIITVVRLYFRSADVMTRHRPAVDLIRRVIVPVALAFRVQSDYLLIFFIREMRLKTLKMYSYVPTRAYDIFLILYRYSAHVRLTTGFECRLHWARRAPVSVPGGGLGFVSRYPVDQLITILFFFFFRNQIIRVLS